MNESPFLDETNLLLSRLETIYLEFYYYKNMFKKNCHHFLTSEEKTKHEEEKNSVKEEKQIEKKKEEDNKSEIKEEEEKKEEEKKEEEKKEEEIKSKTDLYKKLVLHCHPDKQHVKDSTLFSTVQNSQHKYAKQCFLAKHIGIPIHLNDEEKKLVEEAIQKKKKKVEHLKKTYPVSYALASEKEREKILTSFNKISR